MKWLIRAEWFVSGMPNLPDDAGAALADWAANAKGITKIMVDFDR